MMNRRLIQVTAIAALFCFTACLNKNAPGLWFYTHSNGAGAGTDTLLTPTSFLDLQKDGAYTRDFGSFDYGQWKIINNELLLTSSANVPTKIPVKYLGAKDLQLETGKDLIANFEAQPASFASKENDPFSLANNQWRIPAARKESEAEIRKRLYNHCQFWVAYFNWANDYALAIVDVRSTPTLIKIYGNGFGLKPYEELPATWRSYFYDAEDCRIANNLIYEIFQYHDISWAHTDNKYKMFIGAFQQMQQFLK